MLRRAGQVLLAGGAVIGAAVGVGILLGVHPAGLTWIAQVGLAKLALVASGALMAGGATCLRLDRRAAERQALESSTRNPNRE